MKKVHTLPVILRFHRRRFNKFRRNFNVYGGSLPPKGNWESLEYRRV